MRQRHITARTFGDVAAVPTEDEGRLTTPIDEQNRLLVTLDHIREGVLQRTAEDAVRRDDRSVGIVQPRGRR